MAPRPADRLHPPAPAAPLPDVLTTVLVFIAWISPSYWLGVILEHCFGRDPFAWVAEEFTGDWQAVAAAGVALKNLAAFNGDTAAALREGTAGAVEGWEGRSAAAEQLEQLGVELARRHRAERWPQVEADQVGVAVAGARLVGGDLHPLIQQISEGRPRAWVAILVYVSLEPRAGLLSLPLRRGGLAKVAAAVRDRIDARVHADPIAATRPLLDVAAPAARLRPHAAESRPI